MVKGVAGKIEIKYRLRREKKHGRGFWGETMIDESPVSRIGLNQRIKTKKQRKRKEGNKLREVSW